MSSSPSSLTIGRASNLLRLGASDQIAEYESRFQGLQPLYDSLFSSLIVSDFSYREACETAQRFFGSTSIRFAGIDGTMYTRTLFDLVIFFGGAYTSTGTITFTQDSTPTINYDMKYMKQGAGISSVVPVYINEIPDIDHSFFSHEEPREIALNKRLQGSSIIDNATIANWIMTFAEYYLAWKLAADSSQDVHVILLDRSLSVERSSLLYETSKRDMWKAKSSLIGYKIDKEPIDANDLSIGRHYIQNAALSIPPPRAGYLRHAIIRLIQQKGTVTQEEILQQLGIRDKKRARRAGRCIRESVEEEILIESGGTYTVNSKYTTTWARLKKLVTILGDQFFYIQEPEPPTSNLMKIEKDGKEHWLTTLDIAFLTLFSLNMLLEACWENRVLLVGVTKDTAARDMKRQLLPILNNEGLLERTIDQQLYEKLPNTDRMILQSISIFNPEKVKVPWSLIEYDSAFRSMLPDPHARKGYVLGAIKNRISLEKTFLKTYVQLAQAKKDHLLRSNVLLIDRLAYPEHDHTSNTTITFLSEFGGAEEPLEIILYKDKTATNPIQNLTMIILTAMSPSSIPEAFGHNKPLFIADKIAKWHYRQFKRVADTTATWILNNHKLRKLVFYMSTFRERRAAVEATRREAP